MRPDQNAVFIAYARADAQFVLELATALRAAGASVWVDQLDIPPGTHWDQNVEEALSCCARVLVVLSPAAVASQNVLDEVSYALEARKEIIPVLYQPCLIPLRLKRLQYIDLTGNYEAGFRRLLDSLGARPQPSGPRASAQSEPVRQPVTPAAERPRSSARLHLFGGVSLEGERGPIAGRGAQRRRLALLALLATSRHGISRDKLIGYLWEEADTERARRVLSEAIYVIRKSLGEDAVLTSGDEVRLNPQVVWSDVTAFNDALEHEQLTTAVELYRGPFLDGFFISDALEFDQWAERERDRLARAQADALQKLADQAEAGGDFRAAARWWRKLTEHDKYGVATTIGLMRALDAAGDRAAALLEARAYATRMRADLEAEPDAQVEAFAKLLRDAPPGPLPERVLPAAQASAAAPAVVETAHPPSFSAAESHAQRKWPSRVKLMGALGVVFVASMVILAIMPDSAPIVTPTSVELVAVLPFEVRGPDATLGPGLAGFLSSNLDGAGPLHAVDSNALLSAVKKLGQGPVPLERAAAFVRKEFRARYFVLTTMLQTGPTVTLQSTMYDTQDSVRRAASGTASGNIGTVLALLDKLSIDLLAYRGSGPAEQLTNTAARSTMNYDAFKLYIEGDAHFRAGRYDSAAVAFNEATKVDPNFALAYYRLSAAAAWDFQFTESRDAGRRARELSIRLPQPEGRVLYAWLDFLDGKWDEAYQAYDRILRDYPTNVEALSGKAEVTVHFNPIRGLPIDQARQPLRDVLALAPDYGEVRFHLMEIAARDRDTVGFQTLLTGLSLRNPQYIVWRAVRAFTFGTITDQTNILSELDKADPRTVGLAAGRVAAHTHNFAGAEQIARRLLRSDLPQDWRAAAHLLLAELALGANDWPKARRWLAEAEQLERDWTRELSALFLLHPAVGATKAQILAERKKLQDWEPEASTPEVSFFFGAHVRQHPTLRLYLLGLLSAAAGQPDSAISYRSRLQRAGRTDESKQLALALAQSLLGHIERAKGNPDAALNHLLAASINSPPEFLALSPFYARAHDRWTIAKIHRERGEFDEAKRWERSLVEGFDFVWAKHVPQ